jgi:lysophospholipase L1-like esterase
MNKSILAGLVILAILAVAGCRSTAASTTAAPVASTAAAPAASTPAAPASSTPAAPASSTPAAPASATAMPAAPQTAGPATTDNNVNLSLAGEWLSETNGKIYDFAQASASTYSGYVVKGGRCAITPGDIMDTAQGNGYYTGTENTFTSFNPCTVSGTATNTIQIASDGETAQWDSSGCSNCGLESWTRLGGAASSPVEYAALGDSYSSGEGAGNYGTTKGACDRSDNAWPNLVAANNPNVVIEANLACSGADSEALSGNVEGQPDQLGELAQLNPRPALVTMTIGGNDVGFSDVLADCYQTNCIRDGTIQRAEVAIADESKALVYDYRLLADADPSAKAILIVGYPRIFEQDYYCGNANTGLGFKPSELAALNQLGVQLNEVIANAVAQVNASQPTPRFHYVDVTNALQGHELCTQDPWVNPSGEPFSVLKHWVGLPIQDAHPNPDGQQAIANVVRGYISSISSQL